MRLINTSTLQFRNFELKSSPPYTILSHRWASEDDEPTYSDFRKGRKRDSSGHRKLLEFCAQSQALGFDWGWADTVCIDKKSSAELSEAVNSMFAWYKWSTCCLAYLSDVDAQCSDSSSSLGRSAWFTRGWTLQELLAPRIVLFYDRDWHLIGYMGGEKMGNWSIRMLNTVSSKPHLTRLVSAITRIPRGCLTSVFALKAMSIAERMSWASKRLTTRDEDRAYCLLGLFGVNLPLLYGEGGVRAFERLQRGIIEASNDESIFAWSHSGVLQDKKLTTARYSGRDLNHVGPLARGPEAFEFSATVTRWNVTSSLRLPPFRMTNRGLELNRPSWTIDATDMWAFDAFSGLKVAASRSTNIRLIRLACAEQSGARTASIACYIFLIQDKAIAETHQWFRFMPDAGKTLIVEPSYLSSKVQNATQLFYIGSFREFDDSGPSVDWSISRRAISIDAGGGTTDVGPSSSYQESWNV